MTKKYTDQVLLLGVDEIDPTLPRKIADMGFLPNINNYITNVAQK